MARATTHAADEAGQDRGRAGADRERDAAARRTLLQALISIGAALVFMALMFWPQTVVPMEHLNRLILWPATFIQFWAGGRFYRAARRAARHGAATMDTLAVGTTAAWAYSVFVTMYPDVIHEAGLHPETYFDSSASSSASCSSGGSRTGPRAGRPGRSGAW